MSADGKGEASEHSGGVTMLKAALLYAARGHPVFPCGPQKKPLTKNGFKDATTDESQIRKWWAQWPDANIGHPTGSHVVLDVDGAEGEAALAALETKHGELPATLTARTGRGRHLYFAANGVRVRNSAGKLGPHLDVRGEGGYVILPPSVHQTGKLYEWVDRHIEAAPLPEWFAALLVESARSETEPPREASAVAGGRVREGQRNTHLTSLAGTMRRRGMSQDAILAGLLAENVKACAPPLPETEVRGIVKSIGKKEPSASPPGEIRAFAELRRFSDIRPKMLRWLWLRRIPLGKLTLIAGDPGLGKSLITIDIAARVSKGSRFPDGAPCEPGDVIILSAEDDAEDTIRPRLDAAGAEVSRIHLLEAVRVVTTDGKSTESTFNLERDIPALEDALIRTPGARLVTVDPVSAYVGSTDSNANAEVRGLLKPLVALATKYGVAVILITHLRKSGGAAIYRAMGSLAFAAAARAHWGVVADLDNKARRLFLQVKQNLAPDTDGLAYGIGASEGIPRVVWESEPVTVNADVAMGGFESPEEHSERREAEEWLKGILADGALPATEVRSRSRSEVASSWRTIRRAADSIGVVKEKTGGRGTRWEWSLPKDAHSKVSTPICSELATLATFDNSIEKKRDSAPENSKVSTKTYVDIFDGASPASEEKLIPVSVDDSLFAPPSGMKGEADEEVV